MFSRVFIGLAGHSRAVFFQSLILPFDSPRGAAAFVFVMDGPRPRKVILDYAGVSTLKNHFHLRLVVLVLFNFQLMRF